MKSQKALGFGIMIVAIILFATGFVYVRSAEQAIVAGHILGPQGECQHQEGQLCPYEQLNKLTGPKYFGLLADVALFGFGLFLFLKRTPEQKLAGKARRSARQLGGEEGKAFDIIAQAGGMIFQNELVEKLGVSKVKVTRVLDKLEAKGLVERRRRGMTNVVVLK